MIAGTMTDMSDIMSRMKGRDLYFHVGEHGSDIRFHFGRESASVGTEDVVGLSYLASCSPHFTGSDRIALAWSAKDVFSLVKRKTEISMEFGGSFYDLSLISSYLSVEAQRPRGFRGAVDLLKALMAHPGWKAFSPFYSEVYAPLASTVIPDIETCCLVDNRKRMCVYPLYGIEGQANGRLKATAPTESNYNPHSMGADMKRSLRPPGYDQAFVHFDYRNMEVNVLQWLSGDRALGDVLEGEDDPYRAIWSMVTRREATEAQRGICKEVFLPVVFGQGPRSLAEKLGAKEEIASKIIDSLVSTFPVAFDWVSSQSPDGDNMATDRFGRRRRFDERELYKIRNFSVQSPASMICLRKLVRLHGSLSGLARVCFHVHDGYCVVCDKNEVREVSEIGTSVLEEEDPLFPGLRLRSLCCSGGSLSDLKPTKRGVPHEAHT